MTAKARSPGGGRGGGFSLPGEMSPRRRAAAHLRLATGHACAGHAWSAVRALRQARQLDPRSAAFGRVADAVAAALEARGEAEAAARCAKLMAECAAEGTMTSPDVAPRDVLDA